MHVRQQRDRAIVRLRRLLEEEVRYGLALLSAEGASVHLIVFVRGLASYRDEQESCEQELHVRLELEPRRQC